MNSKSNPNQANQITDILPAGINTVTAVTLTKAKSADSQMSALLDRMEKLEIYHVTSHRPRGILVAKTIQDHNRKTSRAGIIDVLKKLSTVRNPVPGNQRNRKTRN